MHASRMGSGRVHGFSVTPIPMRDVASPSSEPWPMRAGGEGGGGARARGASAMWLLTPMASPSIKPCAPAARAAVARERDVHQPCGSLLPWPRRASSHAYGHAEHRAMRAGGEGGGGARARGASAMWLLAADMADSPPRRRAPVVCSRAVYLYSLVCACGGRSLSLFSCVCVWR